MSTLRFIIEGAHAADQATELKQYLQTEWDAQQVEIKSSSNNTQNTIYKSIDFDSIRLAIEAYGTFKLVINSPNDVAKVKRHLQKLVNWVEERLMMTLNGKVIWIEVDGVSYPLVADKIDDIIKEMQKQEEEQT